jgi:apolipoprotein N-acyltransferase
VPLVRAANTGISCAIDVRGQVQERLRDADGRHDGPGFQLATVQVPHDRMPLTFYTRHGDVFAWSCLGPGILAWLVAWRFNRRSSGQVEPAVE